MSAQHLLRQSTYWRHRKCYFGLGWSDITHNFKPADTFNTRAMARHHWAVGEMLRVDLNGRLSSLEHAGTHSACKSAARWFVLFRLQGTHFCIYHTYFTLSSYIMLSISHWRIWGSHCCAVPYVFKMILFISPSVSSVHIWWYRCMYILLLVILIPFFLL